MHRFDRWPFALTRTSLEGSGRRNLGRRAHAALPVVATVLLLAACTAPRSLPTPSGPDGVGSVSRPVALAPGGAWLWVVNPDANTVTPVNVSELRAGEPRATGSEPRAVAVAPSGTVVVMNRADGSLSLLEAADRTDIAVGAELGGLALSPTGRFAFVSVASAGELAVVDTAARSVAARAHVGALPWTVAVTDDGDDDDLDEVIIVAHRQARPRAGPAPLSDRGSSVARERSADDGMEAWLSLWRLERDGPTGLGLMPTAVPERVVEPYDFGFPNQLAGLALNGDQLFVTHLLNAPALPRTFDTTVSAALSSFSLRRGAVGGLRLHLNDPGFSPPVNNPSGVALSADGGRAYLALAGTDAVMGVRLDGQGAAELIGFWPTGRNPRGITLSPDGSRAFVMNNLSRDLSVLDLSDEGGRRELARVPLPGSSPEVHLGRVLFNSASDPRISERGWMSCASCHPDGGSDGTTWLTPDGPRQTMPLWAVSGTAPYHASATRDEVQDFEQDIETLMAGVGLAPGKHAPLLGAPNAGSSHDLDALAAYLLDGIRVPAAAPVAADQAALVHEGRALFGALGCAACHGGPSWTRSRLPDGHGAAGAEPPTQVASALVDVGTFREGLDVLGAAGFDVPTLLGLHATAPYLHDGSAATLEAVLANPDHVGAELARRDVDALAAYLRTIDAASAPWVPERP